MAPKGSKLNNYINYRMRVTLQDGRNFIGTFKGWKNILNNVSKLPAPYPKKTKFEIWLKENLIIWNLDNPELSTRTFENSLFVGGIFIFEIFGPISHQEVIYGPYSPYILLKSPYMDRTDLICLEENPYMDRQSIYFW